MKRDDNARWLNHAPVSCPFQTPLHLAVITSQADVCQRLLVSGCDPTLVDDSGDTALHIACRHGNLLCFSVVTQNCRPEHLHTVMAACNYHGESAESTRFLLFSFVPVLFPLWKHWAFTFFFFFFIIFLINDSVIRTKRKIKLCKGTKCLNSKLAGQIIIFCIL